MKKERVRASKELLEMVCHYSVSILCNNVTIVESAVALHTPETKQQSKQWLEKGSLSPSRLKKLDFFDLSASYTPTYCN
jgi:hypothetical protein